MTGTAVDVAEIREIGGVASGGGNSGMVGGGGESDLPNGWARATLGELGEWFGGSTPSKRNPHYWSDGTIPWLSPKDMGEAVLSGTQDFIHESAIKETNLKLIPAGSVTFVVRSGILERKVPVAYVPFEVTLNQDMKAIAPHDGIDARWLAAAIKASEHRILTQCRKQGTTVASLEVPWLQAFEILVPPLAEQRRIVAKLDEQLTRVKAGERSVQAALSKCDLFMEQILALGTSGGLSHTDRFPTDISPADSDDGELPDLPVGWTWRRLGEIAAVVGGITKDSKKQGDPDYVEVPYLRVANVQRGRLILDRVETIRVPPAKAESLRLVPGDVLLNEGGDRDKLGRGWIWEAQIDDCIHQNHVFRARVIGDVLSPLLLAWHANSFGKSWCDRNGKQTVNLASISLRKIKLLPVPVPPRDEQDDLVQLIENYVEQAEVFRQTAKASLAQVADLRAALLHAAFTGTLVPQDPTDEPASVLLDRIRAQRSAASTRSTRRRAPRTSKSTGNPGQGELPL
ncbi:restriction endonuclease subunit S [Streptomyces vietnamensis]|uniref:restriction endonuclease subunit S n=1 Tax=Streptomyces vietnamensis TaxID=362257 RepID=UPI00099DBBDA|nr:restriction endonuclease subunit S [Streptomyces vietnamensis]